MKRNSKVLFRVILSLAFGLSILLTSCPSPASSTIAIQKDLTLQEGGLRFDSVAKTITLSFTEEIADFDSGKVILYHAGTQVESSNYEISLVEGKLVISLLGELSPGERYTVNLEPGAVSDDNGNTSRAPNQEPTLLIPNIAITEIAVNRVNGTITLSFTSALMKFDTSKIEFISNGNVLSSNAYSVDWSQPGVPGDSLLFTLNQGIGENDIFNIKFKEAALTDASALPAVNIPLDSGAIDSTAPALSAQDSFVLDPDARTLSIRLNMAVKALDDSKIALSYLANGESGEGSHFADSNYSTAVLSEDKRSFEISFNETVSFAEGDQYKVSLQEAAISGLYGIKSTAQSTEYAMIALPPVLQSQDLRLEGNTFTAVFDKELGSVDTFKVDVYKSSAGNEESKLVAETDYLAEIMAEDKKSVSITLSDAPVTGDTFRLKFLNGALTALNSRLNEEAESSPYTFILISISVEEITADRSAKTITLGLDKSVSAKDNGLIEVYRNEVKLIQEKFSINWPVSGIPGNSLVISLVDAIGTTDTYNVRFLQGALEDSEGTGSSSFESGIIDSTAAALSSGENLVLDTETKTLGVSLNMVIASLDASKIRLYRLIDGENGDGNLVADTDYNAAILNEDKKGFSITFTSELTLLEGDQYRVSLQEGALTGSYSIQNVAQSSIFAAVALPPALQSQDLVLKGRNLSAVFDKDLKSVDVLKIEVYKTTEAGEVTKLVAESDYSAAIDTEKRTTVNINLMELPIIGDSFRIQFLAEALTAENGRISKIQETNLHSPEASFKVIYEDGISSDTRWSARRIYSNVVFDNKMWVIGGRDETGYKNDVWNSSDGTNWTQISDGAEWKARIGHIVLVFDNKMWVLGGSHADGLSNDVWSSSDGVTWNLVNDNSGWSARKYFSAVVFDDKMWVIGGKTGSTLNSHVGDVWSSGDGITWTQVSSSPEWGSRYGHTTVVFDEKIWLFSGWNGAYRNDAWSSSDGETWIQESSSVDWDNRSSPGAVVFNNKIWVLGGYSSTGTGNLWSSSDGVNWTNVSTASWVNTHYRNFAMLAYENKIWFIGGYDSSFRNEVFYYGLP